MNVGGSFRPSLNSPKRGPTVEETEAAFDQYDDEYRIAPWLRDQEQVAADDALMAALTVPGTVADEEPVAA